MIRLELMRRIRQNANILIIALLTVTLVWLALLIVNNQYKVRALISDIEQE